MSSRLVIKRGGQRKLASYSTPVGPGRPRKIGLLGSIQASLKVAPWMDPTWEWWAHSSVVNAIPQGIASRLFDPHPLHCATSNPCKNGFKDYYAWLQSQGTPIFMEEQYPEIPAALRFPLEVHQTLWPGVPFGSTTAYMVAQALYEGVTHLGCWGIHYDKGRDYQDQRANAEHWLGIARGAGVQIVIPQESPLCHEPRELYGYESHSTPEKYAAYLQRHAEDVKDVRFSASKLRALTSPEDYARAEQTRNKKHPEFARVCAEEGLNEPMPPELLEHEARTRANAVAELTGATK